MELKRRLARVVAVIAVAFAAGHFVQNAARSRSDASVPVPTKVTPVAAGPQEIVPPAPIRAAAFTPTAETAPAPLPAASPPAPVAAEKGTAAAQPQPQPPADELAQDCPVALDLTAQKDAVIGIALTVPCHKDERIVISHAGLVITEKTAANGLLATEIPALEPAAEIQVKFADGTHAAARIDIPEAGNTRRFGVQWQGVDGFGIHAFENGAGYGQAGDVSASNPHTPPAMSVAGAPSRGGYLTILGDSTVDLPLLAEVYTWPVDPAARVDIVTEAAVTPATCGGELLGETINSFGGQTFVTDLSAAMPACDGIGDYLVLKNLALDPKLAAAN
ncbi:MAG: hypothetical protein QM656_14160 [Paracoccaceae bacterium]